MGELDCFTLLLCYHHSLFHIHPFLLLMVPIAANDLFYISHKNNLWVKRTQFYLFQGDQIILTEFYNGGLWE